MHVLITAPRLNGEGLGEVRKSFQLVEALSRKIPLTVLAFENGQGTPLAKQLPDCEVITFDPPAWVKRRNRLAAMLKPEVFVFNRMVLKWLRSTGRRFDLAHQMLPAGARYPTVLRKTDMPYIIGSVGGSLSTPEAFRSEVNSESWFARLRFLDQFRFRHDPWLRASYAKARVVLGVAPYMKDILADLEIARFETFMRQGIRKLAPETERTGIPGQLKLLHVGRAVRTKGLRDAIRAMALLPKDKDITLTSIGDGEDLEACKAEAAKLGVADRIRFEGFQPRERVEEYYRNSDVLLFPSFRESMGGVIFEAMNWGLPVITVARGGPDWIVSDDFGIKVPVDTPEQLAHDLAGAIMTLVDDPATRKQMGKKAREYLAQEATWPAKADILVNLYSEVLAVKG
ncbi:hypothetical protein GCM10016455_29620 [Aliiroseovarius zhejiangensis]|uniref:Glycosyl transferase family 1 domain-containing protein n=1 Tax=Aliiroseovarius zhejiangensis TaxID=1632025 RepID=A0ABQ3J6W3_9RHOB|nr:glycosyltransferase family 4 protein [Aliiroseovarius zhejiangensis]GHF06521.1 hypothetical protein GCM10016455_29620 [Aliiroseovarius zhejiangensis]